MNSITITLEATLENLKKLETLFSEAELQEKPKKEENDATQEESTEKPAPVTDPTVPENMAAPERTVSLGDIRKLGVKMVKAERNEELEALISKHGGTKLSDVPKESYEALYTELEALI